MVPGKGKYANISKGKGASNAKGASTSKSKDVKRERVSEVEDSDDDEEVTLPDVRFVDYAKTLPRFTAIVARTEETGVMMEDLDTLQMELETLLNSVVIRSQTLQQEIAGMTEKPSSPGKRSKQEERSPKKFKDQHGRMRDAHTPPLLKQMKMKSAASKPTSSGEGASDELPPVELTKTSTAKNDTPNKFWASVEPYCAPFTDDDLKFIEELIAAHNDDEEYLKIPPLGRHYSLRWAEDDLHQEQREGSRFGDKRKGPTSSLGTDEAQRMLDSAAKNNGEANGTSPALCGPMTQRLISALLEENIVTSMQDTMESEGQDENAKASSAKGPMNGTQAAALERRIRQELEEQGILTADEANVSQADDEILMELRRCQGELRAISQHNLQQLKRLNRLAQEEIKRQEIRKKLSAADAEILETYRKMAAAKLKKRPMTKKEKDAAWKALRDREAIVKLLDTGQ